MQKILLSLILGIILLLWGHWHATSTIFIVIELWMLFYIIQNIQDFSGKDDALILKALTFAMVPVLFFFLVSLTGSGDNDYLSGSGMIFIWLFFVCFFIVWTFYKRIVLKIWEYDILILSIINMWVIYTGWFQSIILASSITFVGINVIIWGHHTKLGGLFLSITYYIGILFLSISQLATYGILSWNNILDFFDFWTNMYQFQKIWTFNFFIIWILLAHIIAYSIPILTCIPFSIGLDILWVFMNTNNRKSYLEIPQNFADIYKKHKNQCTEWLYFFIEKFDTGQLHWRWICLIYIFYGIIIYCNYIFNYFNPIHLVSYFFLISHYLADYIKPKTLSILPEKNL